LGIINLKPLEYGEVHLAVPGIELLDEEISSEDNWGEFEEDLNDFEEVNEEDPNLLEKVDEGKIINDNVTEGKEISMEVDEVREGNLSDFEEISEEDSNEFKEVDEGDIERKINDDTEKNEDEVPDDSNEIEDESDSMNEIQKSNDFISDMSETSGYEKSEESKYKILSQEDLDKIQHIQNKLISSKDGHSRIPLKRKLEQIYDFEIDPDTIQGYRKKEKK